MQQNSRFLHKKGTKEVRTKHRFDEGVTSQQQDLPIWIKG